MKPVCHKSLLAVACYLSCADARFGGRGGGGLMASIDKVGHHHRQQRARRISHGHHTIIATSTLLTRGGGNGMEENPEYDDSNENNGDSSDSDEEDGHADSSDGGIDSDDESEDSTDDDELHESADDDDDDTTLPNSKPKHHHNHHSKSNKEININMKTTKQLSKKSKFNKSLNKHALKFYRSNQHNFYILLAIIAFRRDIYKFAIQYQIIPTTLVDAVTGERKITIRWSTDVLKLILVGVVVCRFFIPARSGSRSSTIKYDNDDEQDGNKNNQTQSMEQSSSPSSKPPFPLLLLLLLFILPTFRRHMGMLSPILLSFLLRSLASGESSYDPDSPLSRLMLMFGWGGDNADMATRMAYLPPLEQHYTFEQLNERYYRDWGAWNKAFETNPMVAADTPATGDAGASGRGVASGGSGRMTSLVSSLIFNTRKSSMSHPSPSPSTASNATKSSTKSMKYPNEYNNGTVIVLDMTNLDMKASKMDTIRDQISFLIHLVQTELAPSNLSQKSDNGQQSSDYVTVDETNLTSNTSSTNNATQTPLESHVSQTTSPSPTVEIIVLLESPGGGVSQYGLASSHLQRLRTSSPNIKLTICIDEVAASGGYMMACMSSPGQLFCAPFAMVGSIGVIGQSLNVQKTLERYGVRPYVPVGMVGEVTKDGVEAMQESVERIHVAFRDHVAEARGEAFTEVGRMMLLEEEAISKPAGGYFLGSSSGQTTTTPSASTAAASIEMVMDRVATGDVFLGVQALKLGLVDRLITSDEYIAERIRQGSRVLKLIDYRKPPVGLSGLFLGPSHRGRQQGSLMSVWKRVTTRMALGLLAWAEDGLTGGGSTASIPSFA
eukprot:CAMPEP_0202033306 /NCGR_PEP_ID=MMETSP0905-20130828/65978_1 /ASSEMBLY_ACC=CAM_ASM_000554 /TAXON_ID=420261 /ORGANISM="Thalassiosira antarctica, Strain CCMP982" /LENGTH=836 /DNA_ID=CAMNT_0048597207 /DNA_START=77 /DNA_END=2583 /DNA_ORIENTATION=-